MRGWRRRDVMSGEYLSGVRENFRSPPLELSVFSRRKGTNEGFS
jgi:hypothetical protein